MNAKSQTSYIFLAPGFEEVEALATVDALRRADMKVVAISVGDSLEVTGATGQTVVADSLISQINPDEALWLIVPGGVPGAPNLHASDTVNAMLKAHWAKGGRIAAICAGPAVVLAPLGILDGLHATCYPGLDPELTKGGAIYEKKTVVTDGRLITSEGPGTTLPFAITIIRETLGDKAADDVASGMLVGKF